MGSAKISALTPSFPEIKSSREGKALLSAPEKFMLCDRNNNLGHKPSHLYFPSCSGLQRIWDAELELDARSFLCAWWYPLSSEHFPIAFMRTWKFRSQVVLEELWYICVFFSHDSKVDLEQCRLESLYTDAARIQRAIGEATSETHGTKQTQTNAT